MKTSVITAAMALALSLPVQAASNELNYRKPAHRAKP